MKIVIVTGGSGYIGSAISSILLKSGFRIINIDRRSPKKELFDNPNYNYLNYDLASLDQDAQLPGHLRFESRGDEFFGLIHMAAWKDLPGSYDNPLEYYHNNLISTINSAKLAGVLGCKNIIFSSSAGVYADTLRGAVKETDSTDCQSPYGYSKLAGEKIINDIAKQFRMNSFCLRYSNPVGSCNGISADLSDSMFGNIYHALKDKSTFIIFGGDYDTIDGTCIRDYINLKDISKAHVHFLKMHTSYENLHEIINVGTGIGCSCLAVCKMVQELVPEFEFTIGNRREGDSAGNWLNVNKLNSMGFSCSVPLIKSIQEVIALTTP